MAGYKGGRIKRIKIHNFMTYDDLEIYPKKGLNLILGLNGTGKSSIMCAICLGLAGKPQFTGRASQLSDFIKHGCDEAEIEIDLESSGGRVFIRRKLKGDKCEWYLNRSPSNQNEVLAEVKKYNIDTSNLCQFLPQEKVTEFSRMDKKQRLENMLQAIGEPRLFELFNELKVLYKNLADAEQVVKKYVNDKSLAEEKNERISDEVKKQEDRVRLKKKLDEFNNQKKILHYKDIYDEVKQLKEREKQKSKEYETLVKEKDEAVAQENSVRQSYSTYDKKMYKFKSQKTNLTNKLNDISKVLSDFSERVESAKIEFKNKLEEKERQKKRLHDINKLIEASEKQLSEESNKYSNMKEMEANISQSLAHLTQEMSEIYHSIERANSEKIQVEYDLQRQKNQLFSLQDEQQKKMDNLRKRDKYTCEATEWLMQNRQSFKSNVYLPIMLEINVTSSEYTKYLENTIGFKDLIAFVCEDESDCERLTSILKHQKNLPVNIVMAPNAPMSKFNSPPLTPQLRQYGLECYLSDIFTAPEPIMKYLCACYNIHRIPVTKSAVSPSNKERILDNFQMFFTDNLRVSCKRSRYGQQNKSVTTDFIASRNLLVNHDDELLKKIQLAIQSNSEELERRKRVLAALTSQMTEKEKIQNGLRQEKKQLHDQKKTMEKIKSDYINRKQYRAKLSVPIDEEEEKTKINRKIQLINEDRNLALHEFNAVLKEITELEKGVVKLILAMNGLSKFLDLHRATNEDIHEKATTAQKELANISKSLHEKKLIGKRLAEEIKPLGGKYLKFVEKPYTIPDDLSLDEIDQKINHIQALINLNEDNEPLVLEFNTRKRKIEALQGKIDQLQINLDEIKSEIEAKKREWLDPLEHHIGNINQKFSHYFKQLSCAGEICLDIPENSDDFNKYGLQIKLKFHDDEPLTELSQTHHSGGECSVAAIVFILSLQELTEVPFRCIDEINQGMDSVNERKIFQLISESVKQDRCSQYFLLTPKLLDGLEYPEDIAVHIIFNSFFLNSEFCIGEHLEKASNV